MKLWTEQYQEINLQLAKVENINDAINLARGAIQAASKYKEGLRIADQDFEAAFNFLCMEWVEKVLKKKGMSEKSLNRVNHNYCCE